MTLTGFVSSPFSLTTKSSFLQTCNSTKQSTQHPLARSPQSARFTCLLKSSKKKKSALVFGGGSTLGKEVSDKFIDADWKVYTLDFYDASIECGGVNGCALPIYSNVPVGLALPVGAPARTQVEIAEKCLQSSCAEKFDFVLNATLGFTPAGLNDNNIFETTEYMYRTSVESSLVTAKLASSFMAEGGLLSLIGSVAALPVTDASRMLGFGAAKASVHQMVRMLASSVGTDLPKNSSVVAIVPEVLDTPLHRSMNDGESRENWTPCEVVAEKLLEWAQNSQSRPPNSSLISVSTSKGASAQNGSHSSEVDSEHIFRLIQDSSYLQKAAL